MRPPLPRRGGELFPLLAEKTVVACNASFEREAIQVSATPYFSFLRGEPRLRWFCVMEAFAAASGAWHDYYKSYTWQPLETACAFFRLPHDQAHTATGDARVTAQLLHAMAQLAEDELPAGYHLPRDAACAGGCGKTETFLYGDAGDGEDWYCGAGGVRVGRYQICGAMARTSSMRQRPGWRAGVEGRISSLRRDYGLGRCPGHGETGLERRVGWGILASNLWHIGRSCAT